MAAEGEVLAMLFRLLLILLPLLVLSSPSWSQPALLLQAQELIANISAKVKPTVVHLEVWSRRNGSRAKSLGSGVVLSPQGKIVTNFHVIDKAEQIVVILDDRSRFEARVLQKDQLTDLAVLQISAERPLACAELGDSDKAQVGQWVLAIGNPYGLDRTVSFGIISGKSRYIPGSEAGVTPLNDFLQTDALIDPGSSGGPLVDLQGKVLGINSSGIGRGIGFTIPARVVQEVLQGRLQQGQLERGWLGLYPQPLSLELARHRGMAEVRGVLVADLAPGSPLGQAGIEVGDVITALDGQPVEALQEQDIQPFAQQVARLQPGRKVRLEIRRQRSRLDFEVKVGQHPHWESQELESSFGFRLAEVTPLQQQRFHLGVTQGVVITEVEEGSSASLAGLEEGDLLTEWEGKSIRSLEQVKELLQNSQSQLLRLKRGNSHYFGLLQPKVPK